VQAEISEPRSGLGGLALNADASLFRLIGCEYQLLSHTLL
jgi:hypothetical protein